MSRRISQEALERIQEEAEARWNRMVRREEQQIVRDVVAEAVQVAKDSARRERTS